MENKHTPCDPTWPSLALRSCVYLRGQDTALTTKSSLLCFLRRAPRALEGGPCERQHLLGVAREDYEGGVKNYFE